MPFDADDNLVITESTDVAPEEALNSLLGREEFLYFSCGGVEFQVDTRGEDLRRLNDGPITSQFRPFPEVDLFVGTAALNPGFLYEAAHQLEIMVEFSKAPWTPSGVQAAAATCIAREIATAVVVEAGAPILFMHLPAAPYREATQKERTAGAYEGIRPTQGFCLRMSVALRQEQSAERLRLLEAVARIANEWGAGLRLGDRRPGKIRGEWITVRSFHEQQFNSRASDIGWGENGPVRSVTPVTIAGPARVGSSLAVLHALERLNLGIVGMSVTAMQEVAFINLLVHAGASVTDHEVGPNDSSPGLGALASLTLSAGGGNGTIDPGAASDYVVMAGRRRELEAEDPDAGPARPLWLTWDLPFGTVDLDHLLRDLGRLLSEVCQVQTLQYARARLTSSGRVRGRAKVSIQTRQHYPEGGVREHLRLLCDLAERTIRSQLSQDCGIPESEVRLRIMWRERWLGVSDQPL